METTASTLTMLRDTALALVIHIKGRIGTPFRCDLVVGPPFDLGRTQISMTTISLLNSGKVAFCGNSVQIMAIRTALLWRVNARRPPPDWSMQCKALDTGN